MSKVNWIIIWKRFKTGDKEAFALIYNHYIDILFRYGYKLCHDEELVKDAIQEVFIDLYIVRDRNRTSPENLKFYLILALKRNLIKKLTRIRRFTTVRISESLKFEPQYSIESLWIEKEQESEVNRKIAAALEKLTSGEKEAVYLRFNESMYYNDISKVMGITI